MAQRRKINISTVFTTHATLLGRYICAGRNNLYNQISEINPTEEAIKRGIFHRHWVEREAGNEMKVCKNM